jgi:hypothetical protein
MNIASIGSCVDLANADHTDDRLDLVLIRPDQREKLAGYLEQLGRCERFDPPFDSRSVRRVTLQWNPNDGHADDAPWPEHPDEGIASSIVTIEIDGSVSVLVPETD